MTSTRRRTASGAAAPGAGALPRQGDRPRPAQIQSLAHLARHRSVADVIAEAAGACRRSCARSPSRKTARRPHLPGRPTHSERERALPGPTRLIHRAGASSRSKASSLLRLTRMVGRLQDPPARFATRTASPRSTRATCGRCSMRSTSSRRMDASPSSTADATLRCAGARRTRHDRLDAGRVDWILLTHVHLDHAGGAGLLLQSCPNARSRCTRAEPPHGRAVAADGWNDRGLRRGSGAAHVREIVPIPPGRSSKLAKATG